MKVTFYGSLPYIHFYFLNYLFAIPQKTKKNDFLPYFLKLLFYFEFSKHFKM